MTYLLIGSYFHSFNEAPVKEEGGGGEGEKEGVEEGREKRREERGREEERKERKGGRKKVANTKSQKILF